MKRNPRIFSTDSPKAIKADEYGYVNGIHYMAPHSVAGVGNLCPNSSTSCRALCLGMYSGQAAMVSDLEHGTNNVRESRINKARMFMHNRAAYMALVVAEIEKLVRRAYAMGKKLCVRMNGSTDIAWEGIACVRNGIKYRNVFEAFSDVQFVDYTKIASRFYRALPANLYLTFSRSETNENVAVQLLHQGHNVAVVFAGDKPTTWRGFPVIDGDKHDLRHLDPRGGYVVGLSPKGNKAKRDSSGFVVRELVAA